MNNIGKFEWWETRFRIESVEEKNETYKIIYSITININDRKITEISLLENEKELKILNDQTKIVLDNSNSLLTYIDSNYEVKWSNAQSAFGGALKDVFKIKGRYYYFSGVECICSDCPVLESVKSGGIYSKEVTFDNKHYYKETSIPVMADGMLKGFVIKLDDITYQKELINSLVEAKDKAIAVDKMESACLAKMSHDIRTPLNATVGFSELLMNAANDEVKGRYVAIIAYTSALLVRLITVMLACD